MKMIFAANEHLATSLQEALAGYFDRPDTAAVDFCYPDHTAGTRKLAKILSDALAEDPAETFVILVDAFGSTAYNETRLPMAIKYYGLKDAVSLGYLHDIQDETAERYAG